MKLTAAMSQVHQVCHGSTSILGLFLLQELAKHYEAKNEKCIELREKLKQAKATLAAKERELELSQKLLQKLGAERTQLRVCSSCIGLPDCIVPALTVHSSHHLVHISVI